MSLKVIKNIDSLVQIATNNQFYKIGSSMQNIEILNNAAIVFDEKIRWIGKSDQLNSYLYQTNEKIEFEINANCNTIMPGFVDSHTHIVFAGDRSNEFRQRLAGATYKQIAEQGGGIKTTVNATRKASLEDLYNKGKNLLESAIKYGTTSIEIKSGYSLNLEGELKQLQAIKMLQEEFSINITPTFMAAHDIPEEYKDNREYYIDLICNEMMPRVWEDNLAEFCDVFIDEGYFTVDEGKKILLAAKEIGFKLKAHCDELVDTGSAGSMAEIGSTSCDHLLNINDNSIQKMKNNGTVAGLLPGTAYFIRMPYAPARKLIENEVITCLATDCNPGSCFTENMQMILSLAAINMKMSAEEAIVAATLNGAYSLNKSDKFGSIEVGKDANFILIDNSYSDIFYHFGINHVKETWINGKKINLYN